MSNFSLMMVPGQTKKYYGYAVKKDDAVKKDGAAFENVEYEIVTEDSDSTSISDWKLENLAVFDMDEKSVVVDEKFVWTDYVVFEFVARRKDNNNTELKVEMVNVKDEFGEYSKVYEKDGDGFREFGIFNLNIYDDSSSVSSAAKEGDGISIQSPIKTPKPKPEPKEIVLKANKVNESENKYELFFEFPDDEIIQQFSFKLNYAIENVEINTQIKSPPVDYSITDGRKVYLVNEKSVNKEFHVLTFTTTGDNHITKLFTDVKIFIIDIRNNKIVEQDVKYES